MLLIMLVMNTHSRRLISSISIPCLCLKIRVLVQKMVKRLKILRKLQLGVRKLSYLHARNNMYGAIGAVMACVEKHQFDAARTLLTRV